LHKKFGQEPLGEEWKLVDHGRRIIIVHLKRQSGNGLDWMHATVRKLSEIVEYCEHGNGTLYVIKSGEFFDRLFDY
jgi:hypothetical protein